MPRGRPKGSKNRPKEIVEAEKREKGQSIGKGRKGPRIRITKQAIEKEREKITTQQVDGSESKDRTETVEDALRLYEDFPEDRKERLKGYYYFGDLITSPDFTGFLTWYPFDEGVTSKQVLDLYKELSPYRKMYIPKATE